MKNEHTYFIERIPKRLFREFKSLVALEGKTMRQVLLDFMEKYVKEKKS